MLALTQPARTAAGAGHPVDPQLLDRVLRPYKPHCRYLRSATVQHGPGLNAVAAVRGRFAIPESCYIASTGHFNAVEFNICYNQLTYCLLAKCIDENVLAPFAGWSLNEFSRRQLADFLIARFFSVFHTPLRGGGFDGSVEITKVAVRKDATFLKTICRFEDEAGGKADGGATIAVRNSNRMPDDGYAGEYACHAQ